MGSQTHEKPLSGNSLIHKCNLKLTKQKQNNSDAPSWFVFKFILTLFSYVFQISPCSFQQDNAKQHLASILTAQLLTK